MIGGLFEEHPQEDQLENPNLPEPEMEAEVMVNNQPEKPIRDSEREQQAGDKGEVRGDPNILKLMELMNSMNETSKKTNEKIDRNSEESVSYTHLDSNKCFVRICLTSLYSANS